MATTIDTFRSSTWGWLRGSLAGWGTLPVVSSLETSTIVPIPAHCAIRLNSTRTSLTRYNSISSSDLLTMPLWRISRSSVSS